MTRILAACFLAGSLAAPASGRPLTLEQAVGLALRNNEAVLLAEQDLEGAHERIREGWSNALPEISVNTTYDRSWTLPAFIFDTPQGRQSFTIGTSNNIVSGVTFRQPIYSGGKVGAALRAARGYEDYSSQGLLDARQTAAARAWLLLRRRPLCRC